MGMPCILACHPRSCAPLCHRANFSPQSGARAWSVMGNSTLAHGSCDNSNFLLDKTTTKAPDGAERQMADSNGEPATGQKSTLRRLRGSWFSDKLSVYPSKAIIRIPTNISIAPIVRPSPKPSPSSLHPRIAPNTTLTSRTAPAYVTLLSE